MESPARKVKKVKRDPRVPIKTYKWEDVKRSRSKGGYPWTYLYKEPFDEELDPEPYTMESMRKSKSSSTMGKSDVEISEVMDTDINSHAEEPHEKSDELQIITEPDDHSIKRSNSSLVIEECDGNDKDKRSSGIFFLESAESSDDISQYLDKEDRSPTGKRKNQETPMEVTTAEEKEEEPQTRKRKLSAESSYSRISQTKSAILKKIKDTKAKIKIPKISFPTSKLKKSPPKKKNNTPPETKKEIKKNNTPQNTKPLYIHIPLKPLPGEEDEFSHLESGSDQTKKQQSKKPGSFKDLVKNLKQLKDVKSDPIKEEMETEGSTQTGINSESLSKEEEADKSDDTEIVEDTNAEKKETENKKDVEVKKDRNIKALSIIKKETVVDEGKGKETEEDIKVHVDSKQTDFKIKTDPIGKEESVIDIKVKANIIENKEGVQADEDSSDTEITGKNEEVDFEMKDETPFFSPEHQSLQYQGLSSFGEVNPRNFKRDESPDDHSNMEVMEPEEENDNVAQVDGTKYNDMFDKLFAATTSKSDAESQSEREVRSKSAEPERKRKVSLESSYSRKSLSRLGVMKKLKDASDKIKRTLTRSTSKKEVKPKEEKIVKKSKQLKPVTPVEPVYIHIPLKPPKGENDELSHLQADEGLKTPDTDSTTPDSPVHTGVQFIFLTAPSDEEVLDYNSSDVPETPSSENKNFFGSRISELKELAKGAVDEIACPKHKLEPVSEESGDKFSVEGGNNLQESEVVTSPLNKNSGKEASNSVRNVEIESSKKPNGGDSKAKATGEGSEKEAIQVDEEDGLSEPKTMKKENISEKMLENDEKPLQVGNEFNPPETTASTDKEETTEAQSLELKSSLKGDGSPVMKKKVSFKRRSKVSKEGSYEDIQVISSDGNENKELKFLPGGLDNNQSIPVDENKSYLDDKIVKNSSLEEDYNKWSKISDHEYEPVNPPPENIEIIPRVKISDNPTVCIINTDQIFNNSQSFNFVEEEAYKQDPAFLLKFQKDSKLVHSPSTRPKEDQGQIPLGEEAYMQDPAFLLKFQKDSKQVHHSGSREGPSKFQQAIKQRTDNIKTRLHNIKKPHLSLPERPKFHKPNFQKFNLPKLPDSAKINLPSFKLPRRNNAKRSMRERHLSTESNDGDSKKPIFDFSTYPRFFKRKPKDQDRVEEEIPSFATVPRTKKPEKPKTDDSRWSAGSDSVRVPLHSEDSMDADNGVDNNKESYIRGDSIEENEPSHIRYDEDIDSDDAYVRENRELNRERDFLRRWDQGTYNAEDHEYMENMRNKQPRITDLDCPEDLQEKDYHHFQGNNNNGEHYSSGSSQGMHRQGVLEEINSDEFFLRQKGISQDNIEVGMYLSSEIREAFRTPVNALSQMQGNNDFELRDSNQSLPEMPVKRKSLKKPKRKKTPHTSQEKIVPYDEESAEDDLGTFPPPRPTRRSRRWKKHKNADNLIPYQETISLDIPDEVRLAQHRESLGILGDDEQDEEVVTFDNEKMEGKEQPDIRITDQYRNFEFADEEDVMEDLPAAPPRKQKSLKSLNISESDSIMGDFSSNRAIFSSEMDIHEPEIKAIRTESKVIIPIETEVPKRPSRTLSRTNSQSRGTFQKDDELNIESIALENQVPCVEELCLKDLRDAMGYAIIDKSKARDPPLPPPRIPTRRKRSFRNENDRNFFTVPRSSRNEETPVRPLRNYSTLGHSRRGSARSNTYENKENIDISQYIEIEDEPNRDLQSGAVIKKMKDRPLPPPPRPPRKTRPLRDITSQENIGAESYTELDKVTTEEAEVSTQTEPLPDDFICEEVVQEPTDTIIIPTRKQDKPLVLPNTILEQMVQVSTPKRKAPLAVLDVQLSQETIPEQITFQEQETKPDKSISGKSNQIISREGLKEEVETIISTPRKEKPIIEKRLITPTVYSYEETVTHGSLVVQPLDGAKLLPDSEISNVRTIPVHMQDDLEETSSIPEEFNKLRDPFQEENPERQIHSGVKPSEFDVLKAHKLQVSDLDVEKLTVNKLLADKIIVSEIDSSSIQTNEISSKAGALKVGEITLPPEVITRIIETIKSSQVEESRKLEEQKKTSISICPNVTDESAPGGSIDPYETNEPISESPADIPETFKSPTYESPGVLEVQEGPAVEIIDSLSSSEQLHAQKSPFEESTVEKSFPNEADIQERSQESPSRKVCNPEGPNDNQNVPKGICEDFDVQERSPEEENVQEIYHKDICTPESEMLIEPQSFLRESNVLNCPSDESCPNSSVLEDLTVNQSSRVETDIEESPPKPPPRYSDTAEGINVSGNFAEDLDVPESRPEEHGDQETPPQPPPRSSDANSSHKKSSPPDRPPRNSEKLRVGSSSTQEESLQEPDVDDVPPPRPPQPQLEYIPSQPPASFYALRAQKYVDIHGESIPTVPRRRRHAKSKQRSRSSSEESSVVTPSSRRSHRRSSDLSIATLSGQLVRVCGAEVNNSLRRLITYILNNVVRNEDGKQDLNVMIMIVVVLIAGLILLGYGDEKTVVHMHHWEYFNPPGDT